MENKEPTWQSRSGSRKKLTLLLICLVFLIASLVITFIGTKKEGNSITVAGISLLAISVLTSVCVTVVGQCTDLKWEVNNLIFFTLDKGVYFTGVAKQDSYFEVEWNEISGFSAIEKKNGKFTVRVFFERITDAGIFGKINHMNMVNVTDYSRLKEIFAANGIKEIPVPSKK